MTAFLSQSTTTNGKRGTAAGSTNTRELKFKRYCCFLAHYCVCSLETRLAFGTLGGSRSRGHRGGFRKGQARLFVNQAARVVGRQPRTDWSSVGKLDCACSKRNRNNRKLGSGRRTGGSPLRRWRADGRIHG